MLRVNEWLISLHSFLLAGLHVPLFRLSAVCAELFLERVVAQYDLHAASIIAKLNGVLHEVIQDLLELVPVAAG